MEIKDTSGLEDLSHDRLAYLLAELEHGLRAREEAKLIEAKLIDVTPKPGGEAPSKTGG